MCAYLPYLLYVIYALSLEMKKLGLNLDMGLDLPPLKTTLELGLDLQTLTVLVVSLLLLLVTGYIGLDL